MTIKFKKINNKKVKPIKTSNDLDKRPHRGKELMNEPYPNIFLVAKKKSGKSNVVNMLVKERACKNTKVHIFCSTAFIDDTYIDLMEWLDKKGIEYYPTTSIKDADGFDQVNDILEEDEHWINPPKEDGKEKNPELLDLDEKPEKSRKKPSKYKELRRIIIFDDLGKAMRKPSVEILFKKNRHIRSMVLASSQSITDLHPDAIGQVDYTFAFKNHNDEKLLELYEKLNLGLDFKDFLRLYKTVTGDLNRFDFLYISRFEEFRKNFDEAIILNDR